MLLPTVFDASELRSDFNGKVVSHLERICLSEALSRGYLVPEGPFVSLGRSVFDGQMA